MKAGSATVEPRCVNPAKFLHRVIAATGGHSSKHDDIPRIRCIHYRFRLKDAGPVNIVESTTSHFISGLPANENTGSHHYP